MFESFVLSLALVFPVSLRADEKIPKMEGRDGPGQLFFITPRPRWKFDLK